MQLAALLVGLLACVAIIALGIRLFLQPRRVSDATTKGMRRSATSAMDE